jgi:hypothetical protein
MSRSLRERPTRQRLVMEETMRKALGTTLGIVALSIFAVTPTINAAPAAARSYVWFGQFEALDETAKAVTLKAQTAEHIARYVTRFKPGDRLILVWDMIRKTQADTVLALWPAEELQTPTLRSGYILPIEFVSADLDGRTVTFKAHVADKQLSPLKSMRQGQWLKFTAPMEQPNADAIIASIESSDKPQPAPERQTTETTATPGKPQSTDASQTATQR